MGRHVVNVKAIAHAGEIVGRLDGRDETIAVIVARSRTVKNAKRDDLAAIELHDLIPVLRLSSIPIMHGVPLLDGKSPINRGIAAPRSTRFPNETGSRLACPLFLNETTAVYKCRRAAWLRCQALDGPGTRNGTPAESRARIVR